MSAKLIFLTGSKSGTHHELNDDVTTIGRREDRDITFQPDDILVSGHHARITRDGDRFFLEDTDSKNGTFINKERIERAELKPGDVITFGRGGPSAQFAVSEPGAHVPTLELPSRTLPTEIFTLARSRVAERTGGQRALRHPVSLTREMVSIAYSRATRRMRLTLVTTLVLSFVAVGSVAVIQIRDKARLQQALNQFALVLQSERASRTEIQEDLAAIQTSYDSLRATVEAQRAEVARDRRFGETITREFSRGVALIVFSYGFADRRSGNLLRFRVDARGNPITTISGTGELVPLVAFGGAGVPVIRQGSATGFLIDSAGTIVTNRHVARPWEEDKELESLKLRGLDVTPQMTVLRAYFPPGNRQYEMLVHRVSEEADLAVLRATTGRIDAPILPLPRKPSTVGPGEQVVFIGYPTGLHNLVFRMSEADRQALMSANLNDVVALAGELARRKLIQPLVTRGSISDTTSLEVIHTAASTGGGSGGPLIDADLTVIAIHYAQVISPVSGDPFRTQRAVRVRYLLDLIK